MTMTPAPGWYADAERPGGHRWWNGETWTEDRQGPPTAEAPVKQRRGDKERELRRNNPAAYVALLLAIVALFFNLFGIPSIVAIVFAVIAMAKARKLENSGIRNSGFWYGFIALGVAGWSLFRLITGVINLLT
jgi:hypothetical protein